ncbi:MAG TPA: T9SS type A sorting domain-containing protein [Bacteroidetes bacterium]|nr:T9SS type A sorting domain-containing protein [Bacteroidota bacterium]
MQIKKTLLFLSFSILASGLFSQVEISLENFASGFDKPLDIAHAGDGRLFIVEQDGAIWILDAEGNKLPTPFLDIDSRVGSSQNEQGLLGLAFHPDYADNGFFYVNYTNNSGDTRISRFSVSPDDPNTADPNSEEILLEVDQPFGNHNGGCVKFGPDGYLYFALGDGGSGGDPFGNGQKRTTFLAKMLRIDVDNGLPYSIPPDNPFADDDFTLDEIWAIGLRNAWRFSFDRATGDLWMGDVGQNAWEEIDFQPASSNGGENYGWNCYEGNHAFNTSGCADMSEMTFPVFEFANSFSLGCSVTGGFVYRGCEFKGLYGHYLFADYCSGRFWSILPDGQGGWEGVEIANFTDFNFAAFGENAAGELFAAGHGNGIIYKITSPSPMLGKTDESCETQNDGAISFAIPTDQLTAATWSDGSTELQRTNLPPGNYSVEVSTSNGCTFSEAVEIMEGEPLPDQPTIAIENDSVLVSSANAVSYQWYLNGAAIEGAITASYVPTETGDYSLVVGNAAGCESASASINFVVTSTFSSIGFAQAQISPNPFGSFVSLNLKTLQKMDFEVLLYDLGGKVYLSEKDTVNGVFEKKYGLQDLPPGVYFFMIKNERGTWGKQVVKR